MNDKEIEKEVDEKVQKLTEKFTTIITGLVKHAYCEGVQDGMSKAQKVYKEE